MHIWKLTPLDLLDPSWEASSHRGIAIVRARSESDARAMAGRAFDTKTRFAPAKVQKFPPWKRPDLVKVDLVDDPRFEAEGPAAVLEPSV